MKNVVIEIKNRIDDIRHNTLMNSEDWTKIGQNIKFKRNLKDKENRLINNNICLRGILEQDSRENGI